MYIVYKNKPSQGMMTLVKVGIISSTNGDKTIIIAPGDKEKTISKSQKIAAYENIIDALCVCDKINDLRDDLDKEIRDATKKAHEEYTSKLAQILEGNDN